MRPALCSYEPAHKYPCSNTKPKILLRITASLFANAISMCMERKMEKEVLLNGIQYFLDSLLNWTLAGTVKWLASEVRLKGYVDAPASHGGRSHRSHRPSALFHAEVLQTLLQSASCPQAVLRLSAPGLLRLFPTSQAPRGRSGIDPAPIRRIALQTLGLPPEG